MSKNNLHRYDLYIIALLMKMKPNQVFIFDPENTLIHNADYSFVQFTSWHELMVKASLRSTESLMLVNLSREALPINLPASTFDFLFSFSKEKEVSTHYNTMIYYYFNNPDQTMRWIYPKGHSAKHLKSLYNGSGWKAKLFKLGIEVAKITNQMHRVASGHFYIYSKNNLAPFGQFHKGSSENQYAIFTGTPGETRKAVIALGNKKEVLSFCKYPIQEGAIASLFNEEVMLAKLKNMNFRHSMIPKVSRIGMGINVSNLAIPKTRNVKKLEDVHIHALVEWMDKTASEDQLSKLPVWGEMNQRLISLANKKSLHPELKINALVATAQLNMRSIDPEKKVALSLCHGDFTPWNMLMGNKKIHVYDWEMGRPAMPMCYDLFHFIFQKGILIERKSATAILEEISELKKHVLIQQVIDQYRLDFDALLRFYLLEISTYYSLRFMDQERLHTQAYWLVETWTKALVLLPKSQNVEIPKLG